MECPTCGEHGWHVVPVGIAEHPSAHRPASEAEPESVIVPPLRHRSGRRRVGYTPALLPFVHVQRAQPGDRSVTAGTRASAKRPLQHRRRRRRVGSPYRSSTRSCGSRRTATTDVVSRSRIRCSGSRSRDISSKYNRPDKIYCRSNFIRCTVTFVPDPAIRECKISHVRGISCI